MVSHDKEFPRRFFVIFICGERIGVAFDDRKEDIAGTNLRSEKPVKRSPRTSYTVGVRCSDR